MKNTIFWDHNDCFMQHQGTCTGVSKTEMLNDADLEENTSMDRTVQSDFQLIDIDKVFAN